MTRNCTAVSSSHTSHSPSVLTFLPCDQIRERNLVIMPEGLKSQLLTVLFSRCQTVLHADIMETEKQRICSRIPGCSVEYISGLVHVNFNGRHADNDYVLVCWSELETTKTENYRTFLKNVRLVILKQQPPFNASQAVFVTELLFI